MEIKKNHHSPFTLEERNEIEKRIKRGWSLSSIAIHIQRSKNGVITEVKRNGGRIRYNAELAQKEYESSTLRANEKRRNWNQKQNRESKISNQQKIEKLESMVDSITMQLDILFETLREIQQKT